MIRVFCSAYRLPCKTGWVGEGADAGEQAASAQPRMRVLCCMYRLPCTRQHRGGEGKEGTSCERLREQRPDVHSEQLHAVEHSILL